VLEDLKSTNGTFVNDKPIARHTLLEGDTVLVGKHTLLFTQRRRAERRPGRATVVPESAARGCSIPSSRRSLLGRRSEQAVTGLRRVVRRPRFQPRTGASAPCGSSTDKHHSARIRLLSAVTTMIGKADPAQIRLGDGSSRKIAGAAIARKGDGFRYGAWAAR
jgi:hypothetical protein